MTQAELIKDIEVKFTEMKTISEKEDATAEEYQHGEALKTELDTMRDQLETMKKAEKLGESVKSFGSWLNEPATKVVHNGNPNPAVEDETKSWKIPADYSRSNLKYLHLLPGVTYPEAEKKAYSFGRWMRAARGSVKDQRWCDQNGYTMKYMDDAGNIAIKAQIEGINSQGGFLVPEEFERMLIVLREQFGVYRNLVKHIPMGSDVKNVPRQTGNLTTYWTDENTTITESNYSLDQVKLVAKKLACLASWSSELGEDAFIDQGDKLAYEIAYAFAKTEDDCGFNGDGTSTYGGITGIRNKLNNLSGTLANIAGALVQSGTGAYSTTLSDYQKLVGKLPQYADTPNTGWIVHRAVWASSMYIAELAAGGVTGQEVVDGKPHRTFLGYPVHFSQIMPSVYAANQFYCLFGDVSLAAKMGDRRQTTIAFSDQVGFKQDQLFIRGTERIDIITHDVGNANATASLRVPGPIVALVGGTS